MGTCRQEGGHGRPGGGGHVQDAAGRVRTGVPHLYAGDVDAQGEASLLQSFLWHGEGLQLFLAVGHVRVLAAPAYAVQAGLAVGVAGGSVGRGR